MAELKFRTDFETVTKDSGSHLDMGIPNYFYFGETGGANMWMEGLDRVTPSVTPHSGSRCVGMELTDITRSRRNEFNLMDLRSLAGDDVLISAWFYLRSDWGLHSPIDGNWYEFAALLGQMSDPWLPYLVIHIGERGMGGGSGIFDAYVRTRRLDDVLETLSEVRNFPLPRGRWFNIKYELHRREVNSSVKVWIDNMLVCDVSSVALPLATGNYKVTIGKIYHDTGDTTPHYLWVDDLEIWKIIPEPIYNLTFTVKDIMGNPLPNAKVAVE